MTELKEEKGQRNWEKVISIVDRGRGVNEQEQDLFHFTST